MDPYLGEGTDLTRDGDSWELEGTLSRFFLLSTSAASISLASSGSGRGRWPDALVAVWHKTMKQRRIPAKAKAFTLIEAMVAITMIAMMSTVVMLGTGTVIDSADDALHRTIATGLAEQLMDEVMGTKYSEDISVPLLSTLSASISEQDGVDRSAYNDIDDFNFAGTGYAANGPVDPWGIAIGQGHGAGGLRNADFRVATGFFHDWRQEIEV